VHLPPELRCPAHPALGLAAAEGALSCTEGCRYAVRDGIPRFVPLESYANAFGLQWNTYARTQLDSYTGTSISRDRLARCLGGSLEAVRGKSVLEVGCGAGRFTELLLAAGARVLACDLSSAVEANARNCAGRGAYFVCQADVNALPAVDRGFDYVIALGMIQHTPSPERTIAALAAKVAPGGWLVIDHYAPLRHPLLRAVGAVTPRHLLRHAFLRLSPEGALRAAAALTRALMPMHRVLWRPGRTARAARAAWRRVSPVFDYYDRFPELRGRLLEEWAFLDTYDALTDRYKHLRDERAIGDALARADLCDAVVARGGNGVEARARRPEAASRREAST